MQLGMVKTEHWNIWNQIAGGKFMKHLHVLHCSLLPVEFKVGSRKADFEQTDRESETE